MNEVFAFLVTTTRRPEWHRIINARTAGAAKSEYWRDINDCWEVAYTEIRCTKLGKPRSPSPEFQRVAEYRNRPDLHCGTRVKAEGGTGVIVGVNDSCNFEVLFDEDSPVCAGMRGNIHPHYIE